MTRDELIAFEKEVAEAFEAKRIRGPIHLNSETQIEPLMEIFSQIKPEDWVLSTWRSHFHALLKGVPRETVMKEILAGKSMMLHFPEYRFMSSAIVGGMLPIACGLAWEGERVWCFVGDMTATIGTFHDAQMFAQGHDLPVRFVIENNGLSTNTPTKKTWGSGDSYISTEYYYKRTTQHCGTDVYVSF